jgi:hypothetical protein
VAEVLFLVLRNLEFNEVWGWGVLDGEKILNRSRGLGFLLA